MVVLREDRPGEKRLVGYYVSRDGNPLLQSELIARVRRKLPEYMLPSAFVSLERLPLTPNGKVDRRALPPPDPARPELATDYVAPRTVLEAAVSGDLGGFAGHRARGHSRQFLSTWEGTRCWRPG